MVTTQISLDQYLRTSYRPDRDYVVGDLEERNVGEKDHSAVLAFFVKWFAEHEGELKLEAFPEIRIKVSAQQVRVADVAVLRVDEPYEPVLTKPPVVVIEILSPEDRLNRYERRLRDYREFGVPHLWVIDPQHRGAFDCSAGAWRPVDEFAITNPAVRVPLGPLWKKLEALHS
ncbi:MAG TPA: Uma2 family endonuclease [Terriglobales bacterium]|nr:Uma2 family endonuclease [Terriglobales bacterium]